MALLLKGPQLPTFKIESAEAGQRLKGFEALKFVPAHVQGLLIQGIRRATHEESKARGEG